MSDHDTDLDDLDRALLNALQWDFPVDPRPYATLAERLGTTEDDVCTRVIRVKEQGVLRQLSAIFDTRALGYECFRHVAGSRAAAHVFLRKQV